MKLSALNVNFEDPSWNFLGLKKPGHKDIKERYPRKSRYRILLLLASLSWKRLQIGMGMLPITTNYSDELLVVSTSMTLKDPEFPK